MNKKETREFYKKVRKEIINRKEKDKKILDYLLDEEHIQKTGLILTYVSTTYEADTICFIEEMLKKKNIAVPKVEDNDLVFYLIKSMNDLKEGKFNILEPTTNERVFDFSNSVCIVPGVSFDEENNRLGYGGGYYDRFLAIYDGFSIGLTYTDCLVEELKVEEHDIKVNKIIHN